MRGRVSGATAGRRTWIQLRINNSDDFLLVVDAESVGESGFLRCQSPSIQSSQQLEPPLGTAQTLANTQKAKLQWIEERIGKRITSALSVTREQSWVVAQFENVDLKRLVR